MLPPSHSSSPQTLRNPLEETMANTAKRSDQRRIERARPSHGAAPPQQYSITAALQDMWLFITLHMAFLEEVRAFVQKTATVAAASTPAREVYETYVRDQWQSVMNPSAIAAPESTFRVEQIVDNPEQDSVYIYKKEDAETGALTSLNMDIKYVFINENADVALYVYHADQSGQLVLQFLVSSHIPGQTYADAWEPLVRRLALLHCDKVKSRIHHESVKIVERRISHSLQEFMDNHPLADAKFFDLYKDHTPTLQPTWKEPRKSKTSVPFVKKYSSILLRIFGLPTEAHLFQGNHVQNMIQKKFEWQNSEVVDKVSPYTKAKAEKGKVLLRPMTAEDIFTPTQKQMTEALRSPSDIGYFHPAMLVNMLARIRDNVPDNYQSRFLFETLKNNDMFQQGDFLKDFASRERVVGRAGNLALVARIVNIWTDSDGTTANMASPAFADRVSGTRTHRLMPGGSAMFAGLIMAALESHYFVDANVRKALHVLVDMFYHVPLLELLRRVEGLTPNDCETLVEHFSIKFEEHAIELPPELEASSSSSSKGRSKKNGSSSSSSSAAGSSTHDVPVCYLHEKTTFTDVARFMAAPLEGRSVNRTRDEPKGIEPVTTAWFDTLACIGTNICGTCQHRMSMLSKTEFVEANQREDGSPPILENVLCFPCKTMIALMLYGAPPYNSDSAKKKFYGAITPTQAFQNNPFTKASNGPAPSAAWKFLSYFGFERLRRDDERLCFDPEAWDSNIEHHAVSVATFMLNLCERVKDKEDDLKYIVGTRQDLEGESILPQEEKGLLLPELVDQVTDVVGSLFMLEQVAEEEEEGQQTQVATQSQTQTQSQIQTQTQMDIPAAGEDGDNEEEEEEEQEEQPESMSANAAQVVHGMLPATPVPFVAVSNTTPDADRGVSADERHATAAPKRTMGELYPEVEVPSSQAYSDISESEAEGDVLPGTNKRPPTVQKKKRARAP